MDKRSTNTLDSWIDCIFGGPSHNYGCMHCRFRLGVVSTCFVLLAGLITLMFDYFFKGE